MSPAVQVVRQHDRDPRPAFLKRPYGQGYLALTAPTWRSIVRKNAELDGRNGPVKSCVHGGRSASMWLSLHLCIYPNVLSSMTCGLHQRKGSVATQINTQSYHLQSSI